MSDDATPVPFDPSRFTLDDHLDGWKADYHDDGSLTVEKDDHQVYAVGEAGMDPADLLHRALLHGVTDLAGADVDPEIWNVPAVRDRIMRHAARMHARHEAAVEAAKTRAENER